MSNASLKEQLKAMADQFPEQPSNNPLVSGSPSKKRVITPNKKTSKPQWLDTVLYGLELLKAYFPLCFKPVNETVPLKKGIKQDLVKRLSTMSEIVTEDKILMIKALTYYVNTIAYHKSATEGVSRVDLDGNAAEVVSNEEAIYSLARCQHKIKNKKLTN
ncbi:MAG: hypothetical protein ACD_21C00091G0001 [uncultured bacterium]|nr:MAG: hypothetical protein ACD_21C00091G0001 [uncultured bacterium]